MYAIQVEVTKFDALEEAMAELKLKELMWNAIDEWDILLADWTQVSLRPFLIVNSLLQKTRVCICQPFLPTTFSARFVNLNAT